MLLTSMFWTSGFDKAFAFSATVAQMQHVGLDPAEFFAAGTVVLQLACSAMVILRRWDAFGALALAVFTALTIPISHAWWKLQGPAHASELHLGLEHISIIGALILVMCAATWRFRFSSPNVPQTN